MSTKKKLLETRSLSSLEKIFATNELNVPEFTKDTALLKERYSFQVAYKGKDDQIKDIKVSVASQLEEMVTIREVGLAPSEFPMYHDHDDDILRTDPGLFPDPLYPVKETGLTAFANQWRTVWLTVDLNKAIPADTYEIAVIFKTKENGVIGQADFQLEVLGEALPDQKLIHTSWFHTDSLMTYYNVDAFSEAYWEIVGNYVDNMVKYGVNMVLTPLFTPPLDTEIGKERPTVQLVDVLKTGSDYQFNFDKLKRWVDMCDTRGVKYFEFSHLFTQWGAKHAPKIIATENGTTKKIFGWETQASGEEYTQFLNQFLPALIAFIKKHDLERRVYFHVSDEPELGHLESYQEASAIVYEHLSDYPIIDALSSIDFYEKGIVKKPIPSTDHIEPFLEAELTDLWTYYCCAQYKDVANRFFTFPSARNRIIGLQLYKFNITGFLHWGYNFWFTQYARRPINPFQVTDAGHGFPSGDAYAVYPGEEGPISSIRLEVFHEALQDIRSLELLESFIGKEKVVALLEEDLNEAITFTNYPRSSGWLLEKIAQVNQEISKHSSN